MTAVAEGIGNWLGAFTAQMPAEPWMAELREAGFRRFVETGFPTTHDEDWRFTNVAPIARTVFDTASPAEADIDSLAPFALGTRIVFVNGFPLGGVSGLPAGVRLEPLGDDARQWLGARGTIESSPFTALNAAFLGAGALLRVARGAVIEQPVHIVWIAAGGESPVHIQPRTLIVAGAGAQCTVVETYAGTGRYFTNAVTEIVAGEGAVIDHSKVQMESPEAFHVGAQYATVGRSADFASHSLSFGGALVRNDSTVLLAEGSNATLNGLYVAGGSQHIDNHTTIDHAQPHGTSRELYKGILDGHASAVFNGRILVRKDAQKTDSRQTNKNLVLSDDAVIDTKPELQILADDVRCTHGATIGQLDAEAVFYLQSRGIGRAQARRLLTCAFAQDVVDHIKAQSLKEALERMLFGKFHDDQ
jgi:Fe-S cluster assembly protein SufD